MSDEKLEYLTWVDDDGEPHVRYLGDNKPPTPNPHDRLDFWKSGDRFDMGMRVDESAAMCALKLRADGHAFWELTPGDMTSYRVVFVHDRLLPYTDQMKLMAGVCGPRKGHVYEVGNGFLHPNYVGEKWCMSPADGYTNHVLARFIEGVRDGIR